MTRPSVGTTSVNYTTADGTATAGSDYTAKSGVLNIGANKSTGIIAVAVSGDAVLEGDEDLGLIINRVSGGYDIGTAQATGSIHDDDATNSLVVSVGDATIVEGNSGTANAVFTVTLSAPSGTTTPITYETANGSATSGTDYTAKQGTVSIAAGGVTAKISVPVKGDTSVEASETFAVRVTGTATSGIPTDRDHATGRILDDDVATLSCPQVMEAWPSRPARGSTVVWRANGKSYPYVFVYLSVWQ